MEVAEGQEFAVVDVDLVADLHPVESHEVGLTMTIAGEDVADATDAVQLPSGGLAGLELQPGPEAVPVGEALHLDRVRHVHAALRPP